MDNLKMTGEDVIWNHCKWIMMDNLKVTGEDVILIKCKLNE